MEIVEVESDVGLMYYEDVVGEEVYEEMAYEIRKFCVWVVMLDDGVLGCVDNFFGL